MQQEHGVRFRHVCIKKKQYTFPITVMENVLRNLISSDIYSCDRWPQM